jgi:hypothetical protein
MGGELNGPTNSQSGLEDAGVNVRIKLSALWASVMFCYIYADYFGLMAPGKLQQMLQGEGPIGPSTPGTLLVASLVLAIPSVMIFLSVALKATAARWINVVFGAVYTVIILNTMWARAFYIFYGVIEITLTSLVVWYALKWPKVPRS